jgi:hypothetical protein
MAMNDKNQTEKFNRTYLPVLYKQTDECYGRFGHKSYVLIDFAIDEVAIEMHEEDKGMVTLSFDNPDTGLLIEIKIKDFLDLSRQLEKHLQSLENQTTYDN